MRLAEKRLFLLDMDGTIYLDEELFPGTLPFLETVRERGGRYLFLTNNSSRSVDAYIAKLARLGISSVREDFLTSVDALIADLESRPAYRRCYVFGTASFRAQLREAGIPVTDRLDEEIDCLLTGFDTEPRVIGKPQPAMALLALERTGFGRSEALMVGDRLYTDIASGVSAGIDTAFVLSGEGTMADLEASAVKPTWIFDDIAALHRAWKKEELT